MPRKQSPAQLNPYIQRLASGTVSKEDLRSEREVILDLYKHHLKLLLEANIFVYAVTGALLSFVVAHLTVPHIRWVLVFPAIFDAVFGVYFWVAGTDINYNERELNLIATGLDVNVVPRLDALKLGLKISSVALLVVSVFVVLAFTLIC
jgi:hypothetical protein